MALLGDSSALQRLETNSYDTALCLVPPASYCRRVDKLRELYDKAYQRWPPHINLLYPFVPVEHLPRAKQLIQTELADQPRLQVFMNDAGYFTQRQGYTIFTSEATDESDGSLQQLRHRVLKALGQPSTPCNFHLTLGQSAENSNSAREFLLSKAKLLPSLKFSVDHLVILKREHIGRAEDSMNHMTFWDAIPLSDLVTDPPLASTNFWIDRPIVMTEDAEQRVVSETSFPEATSKETTPLRPEDVHWFDSDARTWKIRSPPATTHSSNTPKALAISTYNVLADSHYPLSSERDPDLLRTILSPLALADVLVLQEVTDDFLSYLLRDEDVRRQYPYTSHGPPEQQGVGPLPSLRNVVMLSRVPFTWSWLPFQRRHKGALIACFDNIGLWNGSTFSPLVSASVHLTSGLTDGAVAAKKIQLSILSSFMARSHPKSPWLLSGDFNLTTSALTIKEALQNGSITRQTVELLSSIEAGLTESGFVDCWATARLQASDESAQQLKTLDGDELYEGEEGATFNPRENALAAMSSGTSNNRPQRYDRILVRGQGLLRTTRFNMFGLTCNPGENDTTLGSAYSVPSDHFGIRATLELSDPSQPAMLERTETVPESIPVETLNAGMREDEALATSLSDYGMFPSQRETLQRNEAFNLVQETISSAEDAIGSSHVLLQFTRVGSYALGVWTSASDIDCLCIGNISSTTFFRIAYQRLRKNFHRGIRILRKVEASSGTMLELSVNDVYMDLHYCAATKVVEQWSRISSVPHHDPSFDLPILSRRKLKPYRDLDYIRQTTPNLVAFRLAFRSIKLWAIRNGLYSAKFGYFGGIHLTLMLSSLCKRLAFQATTFTAQSLVGTFFRHYAQFDWAQDMVYDPLFHNGRPRYHRTAREPMVILGFYAPNSNVAHTATVPGLEVLKKELETAYRRLSDPLMTWQNFFNPTEDGLAISGVAHFLTSFDSYIRIDVQYWGHTLSKARKLVGWLESRCLTLIVETKKSLPSLNVRIWPGRFAATDSTAEKDYQGCYLVGLARIASSDDAAQFDRRSAKDALLNIVKRFESQLQNDEKYYDASSCWIGVDIVPRNDVAMLGLDEREWGDPLAEEEISDIDEDEASGAEAYEGEEENIEPAFSTQQPSYVVRPGEARKLRPASDILNRLRWDPNLNLSDYIVGYEDRFTGAKETTLEKWKTEKTDEEFIPQHRILYFRRRSDGVVVWERRTRIDLIFGSGIGAGDPSVV